MWFIVTGRVPSKVVVTFFIPVAAMGSVLQLTSLQKFHTQTDACERSLVTRSAMSRSESSADSC